MKLDLPTDVGMLFDLPADSTSKVIWCRRAADRYCRSNKKDNGRDRQRRDRSVKMLKIRELLCCADRACCDCHGVCKTTCNQGQRLRCPLDLIRQKQDAEGSSAKCPRGTEGHMEQFMAMDPLQLAFKQDRVRIH